MKALVWVLTGFLAAVWTLIVALLSSASNWLAANVGSTAGWAQQAANWPLPTWLTNWFDPALLEPLRAFVAGSFDLFTQALPWVTPMLGWVSPALWIFWALTMALLVALAGGAHYAIHHYRQRVLPH